MATNKHLQQFAEQLATWAEQIIENGRTPFRRVDLFHRLHTAAGPCRPPLIFWINRQSMIAGGLIFLPDSTTDKSYVKEAAAATALSLRHFVTWEREEIIIWEVTAPNPVRMASLPLAKTQAPAVFHHRLYELIDQLKLLSVTGRIAAPETSPFYLLNLLEETVKLSFPALLERCRLERSENASVLTAEEEAESWNRLTILRLLSLLHWKLLPNNLPVEQLLSQTENLLRQLPEPLGETFRALTPAATQELPSESAVAFHHLLLRLQQIGWHNQEQRGEKTLRALLKLWYAEAPQETDCKSKERLLVHSHELAPTCSREISYSGAQLAANTLKRVLDNLHHPAQLQGDTFKFSSAFQEKYLHANFFGSLRPESALRRELSGHLRNSWPNRRLIIPGNLPFWSLEAAHMLGLTANDGKLELHLPENWLQILEGTFFSELLFENFALSSVDCREKTRHLLRLTRRQEELSTQCLLADGRVRTLELGTNHNQSALRLRCALELPDLFYDLFMEQQLVPLSESGEQLEELNALAAYAKSRMGQQLWRQRTPHPLPNTTEKLLQEGKEIHWLIPETTHLKEFHQLLSQQQKCRTSLEPDELLAQVFGLPHNASIGQFQTPAREELGTKPINRNLSDDLLRQIERDGVPHFPQTYLYRQATGPLHSYRFVPPLRLRQELLGEYELEDTSGARFHVTGEETKDALLLASALGVTTLEIPEDRQQTAEMLDNYRLDLLKLQEKLTRLCLLHIEQPHVAQRLQKKLWQQLPLPPFKWLSG